MLNLAAAVLAICITIYIIGPDLWSVLILGALWICSKLVK